MSITFDAMTGNSAGDAVREGRDLNVHNGGGIDLLKVLGYLTEADLENASPLVPPPLWGDAEPGDFLGRVLLALALLDSSTADDLGTPAIAVTPRWIIGAREPGYLKDRLEKLRDLAEWAKETGRTIVWY